MKKLNGINICVLTGAGISAESGISTFRGAGGLWEGHDIMEVASPQGWKANPELVLGFYNARRRQLSAVEPNQAHLEIASLEAYCNTVVITQNVDDLHERAGSSQIIHLHGELNKMRSTIHGDLIYPCTEDIRLGACCEKGSQLRPHIVWFGEAVPMLEAAISEIMRADFVLIVGTSMQVYPAASLTAFARENAPILYVDPNPSINYELQRAGLLKIFQGPATTEVPKAIEYIYSHI